MNENSSLPNSVYPTKKDLWISIILYGVGIIFIYNALTLPFDSKPIHPYMRVFATLFLLFFALMIFGVFGNISYILTKEHLIIKVGYFKHSIMLKEITAVIPTHNPLSAPALSLDRLHIKFKSSTFGALISPVKREKFFQDLLLRCPQLVQENDRLVLGVKPGFAERDRNLLDHWIWESPLLGLFVFFSLFIPGLICFILIFIIGPMALFILFFTIFAPTIGFGYWFVGKKVNAILKPALEAEEMAMAALIVRNIIEAPGIVILEKDSIIFHTIIGKRFEVMKRDITKVQEVSFFNGSLLIGKKGFWFTHSEGGRLACAIPKSYVPDFKAWLLGKDSGDITLISN